MSGNVNLIYSVLRSNEKFTRLFSLEFEEAQEKLAQIMAARRKKAGQSTSAENEAGQEEEDPAISPPSIKKLGKTKAESPASGAGEKIVSPTAGDTRPIFDETGKFVPTEAWFDGWKRKLPLAVILIMIDALAPSIEKMCVDKGLTDELEILQVLENATLVGILPPPHAIFMRRFSINDSVCLPHSF